MTDGGAPFLICSHCGKKVAGLVAKRTQFGVVCSGKCFKKLQPQRNQE